MTRQLRLPSRLGSEKVAVEAAASAAADAGFPPERIDDLKTAVAEACINAIEHGNRLNESKSVLVELTISAEALEVRVTDQGAGVDAAAVAVPDIDAKIAGLEQSRGMGLFLMRSLVDEAEWGRAESGGSCVRLVIRKKSE